MEIRISCYDLNGYSPIHGLHNSHAKGRWSEEESMPDIHRVMVWDKIILFNVFVSKGWKWPGTSWRCLTCDWSSKLGRNFAQTPDPLAHLEWPWINGWSGWLEVNDLGVWGSVNLTLYRCHLLLTRPERWIFDTHPHGWDLPYQYRDGITYDLFSG